MNNNCYIIGKSLLCSLGGTQEEITKNIQNLNQNNYEEFLKNKFSQKAFYNIDGFTNVAEEKFFNILKQVIDNAIIDASLKNEDKEDLHIFIGSTSMGVSIEEDQNKKFYKDSTQKELANIGYGYIGTFVEEYINSKHKSLLFSTACTSSINALSYASKLILNKKIKKAIVIGIELYNDSTYKGFSSFFLLSQKNIYRPFDERSDGIILGEGCSAVILSSESKNNDDFRYISSANICDNYSETTSDPSGEPILKSMQKAIKIAKLTLKDIDLIKAHATGSANNNESEAKAITNLFLKENIIKDVTALKPYIGHTLGACGINELVILLYSVQNNFLPACLGFEKELQGIGLNPLTTHKKITNGATILLNFVAFGGNNSSLIISNKS